LIVASKCQAALKKSSATKYNISEDQDPQNAVRLE
jgi:hypothetical protein